MLSNVCDKIKNKNKYSKNKNSNIEKFDLVNFTIVWHTLFYQHQIYMDHRFTISKNLYWTIKQSTFYFDFVLRLRLTCFSLREVKVVIVFN